MSRCTAVRRFAEPAAEVGQNLLVEPPDVARARVATIAIAAALGLPTKDAIVLQNSNKLALRLLPCNVFARVAPVEHEHAGFEIGLVQRLAEVGGPVAALEPRVEQRGYRRGGFEVTLWTYYEPATTVLSPDAYADALERLHAAMCKVDISTPHFTHRVADAERLVTHPHLTPGLNDPDRELLTDTLRRTGRVIRHRQRTEQLLHGEPHRGNVLSTATGPLFIDFETCCRGPIEFDLAHAPEQVSEHYPGIDQSLLSDCRQLVLAMVAAWRSEPGDQFPNGNRFGRDLLCALGEGPPWPTIQEVVDRSDTS
jgi:hypothetical protein